MRNASSFAKILNDKLSQNPPISEEKWRNYDSTLFETSVSTGAKWNFSSSRAPYRYRVEKQKFSSKEEIDPQIPLSEESSEPLLTKELIQSDSELMQALLQLEYKGEVSISLPISQAELKSFYRATIKKNHPDLGGNAEDCTLVLEAYRRLEGCLNKQST